MTSPSLTTAPDANSPTGSSTDKGFLGQPKVLANLFGVELWERFSFYGMQGILAIYLYYTASQGGLGMDQSTATQIVGAYGGAVYLSTILAAWLADRLLGPERVLFGSAVVVMAGHIALAVLPGYLGVGVGLALIALGSGGVKATATSLVGSLYDEGDGRRDAGFSLFYMGINIGALLGPLLTGLLQKEWGFHAGFLAAAIGMAAGLIQYTIGRRRLPETTRVVPRPLPKGVLPRHVVGLVVALLVVLALVLAGVITAGRLANVVAGIVVVAALGYFAVMLRDRSVVGVERSRILAFVPLFLSNVAFWSLYQQQFTVLAIYSDQRLDRDLFGWEMPVSWVNSINPVFIITLAAVFAALWTRLGSRQPTTPMKFGAGTAVMGVAFLLFLLMPSGAGAAPLLGLIGILLAFTIAELLISPVGLSASTKLAPTSYRTQMVALYFLSVSLGTALSGVLASHYDPEDETGFFLWIGLAAIAVGVLVMAARRPIHRLMAGVD